MQSSIESLNRRALEEALAAWNRGDLSAYLCRFRIEAAHGGTFQGLPASGRAISVVGFTILRFGEGKCVERWSLVDSLGLLTQIGAFDPHA